MRLRGGFGTPCDAVYSGFVEVYHFEEWGAICIGDDVSDTLAADVVCRQLGFPHGTAVDPTTRTPSTAGGFAAAPFGFGFGDYSTEEAEEPQDRFWLDQVSCSGTEEQLIECNLGGGFRSNNGGCTRRPTRFTVACRTFAVPEALEEVTTPGAGAAVQQDDNTPACMHAGGTACMLLGSTAALLGTAVLETLL